MNVAIIPARGGSIRIPRKNIKKFHGKPMIAYSIETAIDSGLFDKVIVSTEDKEIAKIAREYGAEVPFIRPENLADDYTETVPVIKHAISEIEKNTNIHVDLVCCIYATAPFIRTESLIEAFNLIRTSGADYTFPVTEFDYAIQRALSMCQTSKVTMLDPSQYSVRSQDLTQYFHDAGQFYFGGRSSWLEDKPILSSVSTAVKIPRKYAQDIDTQEDWEFSELLYSAIKNSNYVT